jgi:hypothetical protein
MSPKVEWHKNEVLLLLKLFRNIGIFFLEVSKRIKEKALQKLFGFWSHYGSERVIFSKNVAKFSLIELLRVCYS